MQEVTSYVWLRVLPQGLCLTSSECLCVCVHAWLKVRESTGAQFLPSLDFISTVCYCCSGNFPSTQTGNSPQSSNGSQILKSSEVIFESPQPFLFWTRNRKNGWTLVLCQSSYVCAPIYKGVGGLNVHCVKYKSILHPCLTLKDSLIKSLKSR